jgi:hypothetical protein
MEVCLSNSFRKHQFGHGAISCQQKNVALLHLLTRIAKTKLQIRSILIGNSHRNVNSPSASLRNLPSGRQARTAHFCGFHYSSLRDLFPSPPTTTRETTAEELLLSKIIQEMNKKSGKPRMVHRRDNREKPPSYGSCTRSQ